MSTTLEKNRATQEEEYLQNSLRVLFSKSCHRCGGLMISEPCFDVASNTGEFEIEIRKCLSCGETIDPTILKNRLRNEQIPKDHSTNRKTLASLEIFSLGY